MVRKRVVTARLLQSALALTLVLCSGPAWSQAVSGSQVSGTVKDTSGGALPGAEVTMTKTDTQTVRTVHADAQGGFVMPNLPVGPYQLRVAMQGFNTTIIDSIVLQVSTNPRFDVTLDVGSLSEEVTVNSGAAMVETRASGVGQVIDNQRVVELPLNGRNATELVFLSGLATEAPRNDLNTNKNYPTVTISVAGGLANGMTYIMDGGTHNDPFNNLNLPTLFPDALQEFKVETSALPARYGHHAAAAVNLVTKSGTNQLHGSLFEFLRNHRFNEQNAFATAKDSLKRNQFGGTLGGPLIQDKAFFFFAYQGTIERSEPATTIRYTPTAAMRAGDFTTFASPACNGGRQITLRGPFANNQIAPSQLDPVAVSMLQYLPLPDDECGRYQFGIPNNSDEHQTLAKLDYNLSDRQSLQLRYMYADYDNPATFDGQNALTLSRVGQRNKVHSVVLGHNYIPSASALNSLRFTFLKTLNDRALPEYFTATELGSNISSHPDVPGYFGVNVQGNGFSIGSGATNPGYFDSTGFQLADDVDVVKGAHQLSFGANWIHTKIETSNNRPTNGAFTFNGSNTGLSLADFLVGRPSNFLQGNPVYDYDDHDYVAAYVQDEWRVRPNVTLNVGVRWEPWIPLRNTYGWISHFDRSRFDAGLHSSVYPQAPAGLIFPGDDGYPGKAASRRDLMTFAPRVGLVWTPENDPSMSVRASWGIFYDTPHLFFNTRFSNNPPWGAQITIPNPAGGFSDPYQDYPGGNPFPALNSEWDTQPFPAFGVYVNAPLDLQRPRLQQWGLSVQRQMGDWLFAVSYLGNRTTHLWRGIELNPAVFGPGATNGNRNRRRVLYLADPEQGQFYSTIGSVDDGGRAIYHGALFSVQRRLRQGLSVLSNYTLSRCKSDPATTEITGPTITNPNDPDADYSYCNSDRRHVVNLSLIYRAPTFSGGAARALLSDWQISAIVRWQSGNRSSVTAGRDVALTGVNTNGQRAVQILPDPYGDGTAENYLNRDAFDFPANGTFSDLEAFSIVNPSNLRNDVSLSRWFNLGGTKRMQFRWEVFNVINKVNLGAPVTRLSSSNFGTIETAGDPRIMQFALKFDF